MAFISRTHASIHLLSALILSTVSFPAIAGDAVSATNFKLQAVGGNIDSKDSKAVLGSFTTPLGQNYGLQLDALVGDVDSDSSHGYGFHGFWRDSDKGLLGLTGSQVESSGNKLKRLGFEGEYYFPNFTLAGEIGKQQGDVPSAEYGNLDLTWYPNNHVALSIGGNKADSVNRQHVGVEYQTTMKGLSLFADVAQGNGDYDHFMLGLTYYFGQQKSLKQRHRQDDPRNMLLNAIQDVDAYFVQNPKLIACEVSTGAIHPLTGEDITEIIMKESCD